MAADRVGERDGHRAGRVLVVGCVVAAAAVERVIAGVAAQPVALRVSRQRVNKGAAAEIFDVGQRVDAVRAGGRPAGMAADGVRERRRHGAAGEIIARPIRAGAAVDRVRAQAAPEEIVAGIAGQRIGEIAAARVFDIDQRVGAVSAGRGAAGMSADGVGERDGHRAGRVLVVGRVVAAAAVERVIACIAAQPVALRVSRQRVGKGAPADVFDADQRINAVSAGRRAQTGAGGVHIVGQRDGDRAGRGVIHGPVASGAAVQRVGAAVAAQDVVALETGNDVGAGGADERVSVGRAVDQSHGSLLTA